MQFFMQINLADGLKKVILNAIRHYLFPETPYVSHLAKIKAGKFFRTPDSFRSIMGCSELLQ